MCREKRKCYISSCIAMSANYVVCMVTPTNAHLKKFKDDTSFSTKKCWKRQFSMILGASARRRVWLGESVIMNVEILIQILLSFTAFIWLCFYHACDNYIVRVDIVIVNLSAVVTASSFLLHLAFHAANSLLLFRLLGCVNKLSR